MNRKEAFFDVHVLKKELQKDLKNEIKKEVQEMLRKETQMISFKMDKLLERFDARGIF